MKCSVVAKDRTVIVDDTLTIREVIIYLDSIGKKLSLRRTLQYYGLTFVEERSFVSKYRSEFNLSKSKTVYDIRLSELVTYKNTLLGIPSRYSSKMKARN